MSASRPTGEALLSAEEETRLAVAIEAGLLARAAREDGGRVAAMQGTVTQEELACIERAGEQAWRRFVRANLRLAHLVAGREAQRCALPAAELFQEGCVGLMTALQRFDHRRGCRFSTYALPWIRAMVSAASARRCGEINLPVWRAEALRRARGVEAGLTVELGRRPTAGEVGEVLHRDADWVSDLLSHRRPASLEQCCEAGMEFVDPALEGAVDDVVEPAEVPQPSLAALPPLERQVIEWRFGFVDGEQHARGDIAARLGIGTTRCRMIELAALDRLRRQLADAEAPARADQAA